MLLGLRAGVRVSDETWSTVQSIGEMLVFVGFAFIGAIIACVLIAVCMAEMSSPRSRRRRDRPESRHVSVGFDEKGTYGRLEDGTKEYK
jgi:hypothetical protein